MINDELNDILVERFANRIEQANEKYLKEIGKMLKKIKKLTPTQAHELEQILKYGGNYNEIVRKIAKYTSTNIDEVNTLFENYAKKDQQFYEKFYRYRNIPFVEYAKNEALRMQTQALSRIAQNEMYNFSRSNVLGYTINGNFYNLRETYNKVLDEALINVGQGMETFDSAMGGILSELGKSGIRTLNYESGRSIRLDSAIRMHLKGRLRELHNENQKIFGKEFDYDGWEISVHGNPAPDHELVQGRQFSIKEYENLNNGLDAKDYKGNTYTLDHDGKNGYRPISEMNCYHFGFTIVLGVSKPEYTDDELQQIINENEKGFELNGKHYTMYEGTQMQRGLERQIREQKDIQILAKESDNKQLIGQTQTRISTLTNRYNELNKKSGLPTKAQRLKVSGYRRKDVSTYKADQVISSDNEMLKQTLKSDTINTILPQGTQLEDVRVIAGYQTSKPIKSITKLVKEHPSEKVLWQKKVGTVKSKYYKYEVHWYSNGDREYYYKIKRVREK